MSILVAHGVEVPCSLHGAGNFPDIASVNSPNVQPRHAILRLIFIWPQALCQLDQFEQSMHVPMQLHHESERQGSLTSLNGPQIKRTVEKQLWGLHWVQIDILRKSFNRVTFESLDPCHKYWSCLLGCPSEEAKCRVQNRTNMGTAGWVNHPEIFSLASISSVLSSTFHGTCSNVGHKGVVPGLIAWVSSPRLRNVSCC